MNKPVAWMSDSDVGFYKEEFGNYPCVPLYAAPPRREWVGLTDEEIDKAWEWAQKSSPYGVKRLTVFARAIERAHGIGEKE